MAVSIGLKLLGAAGVGTVGLELLALKNLIKEEGDKLTPEQKTKIKDKIKKLDTRSKAIKEKFKGGKPFDQQAGKKTKKPEGKAEKRFNKGGVTLKKPTPEQTGLKKLPTAVRNKMGYMNKGGMVKKKGKKK